MRTEYERNFLSQEAIDRPRRLGYYRGVSSKGAVDILIRGTFAFLIDRFLENYSVILGGSILHEQIDRAKRV